MIGFTDSVVSGIVSGLIATFLTVVVRTYWLKAVIPWYEERVYRDAKIEGQWHSRVTYSNSAEDWDEFIVNITRKSHRVEGTMTCINGANKGNIYSFKGTFDNLILTGNYASTDPTRLARGTLTLQLVKDGQAMEGFGAIYSPIKGYIFSAKVQTKKQP